MRGLRMNNRVMRSVSTKQISIANTAKKYPREAITVLHPYLDEHWFWEASNRVRKDCTRSVDNQSHADYENGKAERVKALLNKAKDGSYPLVTPKIVHSYRTLSESII